MAHPPWEHSPASAVEEHRGQSAPTGRYLFNPASSGVFLYGSAATFELARPRGFRRFRIGAVHLRGCGLWTLLKP
jgi:hypothetical protein